ncbi:MAG: alpha/beta hydrolase [Bacteroidota bacterium]
MKTTVYLIPGQGADHRLFNKIELDSNRFEVRHIEYQLPPKDCTLPAYAKLLATQIDTTQSYILIGVSLGGMLATEMNSFLRPRKTIVISSAKCRSELPFQYRFQRKLPLYKVLTPGMAKRGAQIMQPIVEPDRNKEKDTFKSMLRDKDPVFLRRTIQMILQWERSGYNQQIIHIHGSRDKTIPIRNVQYDHRITGGSHMMTLTRGAEISELLNQIL